jgi:hypothetical protein
MTTARERGARLRAAAQIKVVATARERGTRLRAAAQIEVAATARERGRQSSPPLFSTDVCACRSVFSRTTFLPLRQHHRQQLQLLARRRRSFFSRVDALASAAALLLGIGGVASPRESYWCCSLSLSCQANQINGGDLQLACSCSYL